MSREKNKIDKCGNRWYTLCKKQDKEGGDSVKNLTMIIVIIAVINILLGIIMRFAVQSSLCGIFPNAFLKFADSCLLLAIALAVVQCLKEKK